MSFALGSVPTRAGSGLIELGLPVTGGSSVHSLRREPLDCADHWGLNFKMLLIQPSGVGVAVIVMAATPRFERRQIFGILARRRLSDGFPTPRRAPCPQLSAQAGDLTVLRTSWASCSTRSHEHPDVDRHQLEDEQDSG